MKALISLILSVLVCFFSFAQKPKANFDHNVFAKKAALAFNSYGLETMCADYNGLRYIVAATGKTLDEVTEQNTANKNSIIKDVEVIRKKGIYSKFERAEVVVIQETPLKIADIVIYNTFQGKSYTLILKNCIQSNTTWILGDHIEAKGEGVDELLNTKAEKDEKFANSFVGKVQSAAKEQQKKDSAERIAEEGRRMTTRQVRGYLAALFQPQLGNPLAQYILPDQIDKPLIGYYVTKKGEKVNAVIAYEAPEKLMLHAWNLVLCKEANDKKEVLFYDGVPNFLKTIKKDELQAFFVGDQLFIQYSPGKWGILISEGAIRSLILITKITFNGKTTYDVGNLMQKVNESAENHMSLSLQFKSKMSEYVKEHTEMAEKIKSGAEGYSYTYLEKIISEYNLWYDQQFPDKARYLPLGMPKAAEPVTFVPINSKEDLKNYLGQKAWEIISITPFNGNAKGETIDGLDKLQQAGKYLSYEFFLNGTVLNGGRFAGTWEAQDKQTAIISNANGKPELFGIRFTQADQFVADTRGYTGGPRESTSTFKVKRPLTEKEWNRYDSTTNSMARNLPPQFKSLINSWTFSKMLKGGVDASEQFPWGKINGKPITIDFEPDGYLILQNGVRKANGIDMSLWSYVKAGDHDLEFLIYNDATKKVKQVTEKYTLVSATSTELIYENKETSTKFYWTVNK